MTRNLVVQWSSPLPQIAGSYAETQERGFLSICATSSAIPDVRAGHTLYISSQRGAQPGPKEGHLLSLQKDLTLPLATT